MQDISAQIVACIPKLRRYARGLTGSKDAADDLVQDTLERAWNRIGLWQRRDDPRAWLFDAVAKKVIGNTPNPFAGPATNPERLSSGILLGREPHEPTFTRNGKELWVTLRGEDRVAILDVERAIKQASGADGGAMRGFIATNNGPAQVWFSADGALAFVASQKVSKVDVFRVNRDANGYSRPERLATLDIAGQDKPGFTPFLKTSPDGREVWFSHKLADAVSARSSSLSDLPDGNYLIDRNDTMMGVS